VSIKPFSEIAEYYDFLFEDVDYEKWARYVVRFFSVARGESGEGFGSGVWYG
jgi:hypothetical protein